MSDYGSIMMREQAAARSQYNFDPRQRLASSRPFLVETFNSTQNTNVVEVNPDDYAEQNVGSRSDESSVQATPDTKAFKKYISSIPLNETGSNNPILIQTSCLRLEVNR